MVPPPTTSATLPPPTALNTYALKQWRAENPVVDEAPTLSWLDED